MGVLKDSRELLTIAKELSAWIKGEKEDALRLECMNKLGIYTTTIRVESRFSKWARKIGPRPREFSTEEVYDVRMYALKPVPQRIRGAVQHDRDSIFVDLTKGLDHDMFRLEVCYRMEEEWLRGLVHRRSSPEPLKDTMRYHLSAQLTDPWSLGKGFREVDVEEFPVTARVQIQEDINTALPILKTLRRMREIEGELLSDYDPHHATRIIGLQKERYRLKKKLMREDPQSVLRELLLLIRPTNFLSYLGTEQDFRLHQCDWGQELFEALGAVSLPKSMEVTTRTDLDLDKPTSKGILIFESGRFSTDIGTIITKTGGRRKKRERE